MVDSEELKIINQNTMNKVKILSVMALSAVLFTACGKYTIDISDMPEEQRIAHEQYLEEHLEIYNTTDSDLGRTNAAAEIGNRYMNLGQYKNAIKYFEEVLEFDAIHFPALNNLAVIYERVEEYEKALEYELRLYDANSTNKEVVTDTIRLLVLNERHDDARGVLEAFSAYDKTTGPNYTQFIGDQFGYIFDSSAE
jgi:tetratricopeptide (TPR) repeat protein